MDTGMNRVESELSCLQLSAMIGSGSEQPMIERATASTHNSLDPVPETLNPKP